MSFIWSGQLSVDVEYLNVRETRFFVLLPSLACFLRAGSQSARAGRLTRRDNMMDASWTRRLIED